MIIATGKTFEYRETLKSLGAKWNAVSKHWELPNATDEAELTALERAGITLTKTSSDAPVTAPRVVAGAEPIKTKEPVPEIEGDTWFFGDSRRHFNTFAQRDPELFAGFTSLGKFVDFIETLPGYIYLVDGNRGSGWNSDYMTKNHTMFRLTSSMPEAIKLAREGWAEGVKQANEALTIIESDHAEARVRKYSVAGGRVNVGKMLTGNPLHMSHRAKAPAKKVITLYVELVMAWTIRSHNAVIRAAAIAAMADILEANGYACEIVGVTMFERDKEPNKGKPLCQITVDLKAAGEPLNINDLVFAFGHPSMLRRFGFAVMAIPEHFKSEWARMGMGTAAFTDDHPTAPGAFYIEQLWHSQQVEANLNNREVKDFKAAVRKIFSYCVPADFPVNLKTE